MMKRTAIAIIPNNQPRVFSLVIINFLAMAKSNTSIMLPGVCRKSILMNSIAITSVMA